jgi:DNA-binding protein HU-beta
MTKAEILNALAEKAGITKTQSEKVFNGLLEIIESELKAGQKVTLTGFGTFEVTERKARTGRNPSTGAEIQIPATKAPKFKPGAVLKEAVAK